MGGLPIMTRQPKLSVYNLPLLWHLARVSPSILDEGVPKQTTGIQSILRSRHNRETDMHTENHLAHARAKSKFLTICMLKPLQVGNLFRNFFGPNEAITHKKCLKKLHWEFFMTENVNKHITCSQLS